MNFWSVLAAVLVAWNVIVFLLMGIDKRKAKGKKRRISEKTLFTCAFLSGGVGILCGMYAFRHKTKHWSFRILVPAAVLVNAAAWYFIIRLHG